MATGHHTSFRSVICLIIVLLGVSARQATASPALRDSTSRFPNISVRNNLLYDIAGAVNLGFEVPVSDHWTLGGNVGIKPWPRFYAWEWHKETQAKWRHILFVPEVRYWKDQLYKGHFFGADALWTHFNVGGVRFPLGLYPDARKYRLQGDFYGIGLFYGYSWWIGRHFRLEAEAGLAAGYADATKYECMNCGAEVGPKKGPALVPKLGLNIAWTLDPYEGMRRGTGEPVIVPGDTVFIPKPKLFLVHLSEVKGPRTRGDELAEQLPFVFPFSRHASIEELPAPARDSMLYVHFPLDRTELLEDFEGNKPILDSIVRITNELQNDPQIASSLISIVGLASIEGRVSHNQELSEGRSRALRDYVMKHTSVPENHFELLAKGEAWDWFEQQLRALPTEDNDWVAWALDIIESEPDPDAREARLKADRDKYEEIRTNLLADQRNSGYVRVYYDNKPDAGADRFNDEIFGLIRGRKYQEAVDAIEADPALRDETVERDPEALNAYGIALYFAAATEDHLMKMQLGDRFDQDKEDQYQEDIARAYSYIKEAADRGSEAARANLQSLDEYNADRDIYRAFMFPQPARQ